MPPSAAVRLHICDGGFDVAFSKLASVPEGSAAWRLHRFAWRTEWPRRKPRSRAVTAAAFSLLKRFRSVLP